MQKGRVNSKDPSQIFEIGKSGETVVTDMDFLLDRLIEADRRGEWIMKAGEEWPKFNYRKGQAAIARVDYSGALTLQIGKEWPKFDFNKGEETLIQIAKYRHGGFGTYSGSSKLYLAGLHWKKFDYVKGLEILRSQSPTYYKLAKRRWPEKVGEHWREPPDESEEEKLPELRHHPYRQKPHVSIMRKG